MSATPIEPIYTNTRLAEKILFTVIPQIREGVPTYALNQIVKKEFKRCDAIPAVRFLKSPHALSIAVNEEVLFGEVSKQKKIQKGDVVKIALGLFKGGYFTDLGFTIVVGSPSPAQQRLLKGTANALIRAIQKIKAGISVRTIASTIERTLHRSSLAPIPYLMGHGIGRNLHEPPEIPNCTLLPYLKYDTRLAEYSVIAIEPIATTGSGEVRRDAGLSFITADGAPVAHFELPVLVTESGPIILAKKLFSCMENLLKE